MMDGEKRKGRPRSFCKEEALSSALGVFLKKGYDAASIDDLTCALGINRPSLYSAFGNKEELFAKVLEAYHERYRLKFAELTAEGLPPRETVEKWFSGFLGNYRSQDEPLGCLIVNSTLLAGEEHPEISAKLKSFHDLNEKLMADYLRKEKRAGRFKGDPKAVSQFLNAVVQGMAVLHRTQGDPKVLKNIVRSAMEAFPG